MYASLAEFARRTLLQAYCTAGVRRGIDYEMRTDCNGLTAQVPTVFLQSDVHATDCNDVFLQSDAHLVGCHAPALPGKTVDRGLPRARDPRIHIYDRTYPWSSGAAGTPAQEYGTPCTHTAVTFAGERTEDRARDR